MAPPTKKPKQNEGALQESTWIIPEFGEKFQNVFEVPGLTCHERFSLIKQQVCRHDFPKDMGFATLTPFLLAAQHASTTNHRICLTLKGTHKIHEHQLKIPMSLMNSHGTVVEQLTPRKTCKQNAPASLTCDFVATLFLEDLWKDKAKYFPDNKLRIKFGVVTEELWPRELNDCSTAMAQLSGHVLTLLDSGDYSDFTIKCGSSKFKVHELILIRSPVFKAMLSHKMLEQGKREMTISDFEPETIKLFLEYIYSGKIAQPISFQNSCKLIQVADKYEMKELKDRLFDTLTTGMTVEKIGEIALVTRRCSPPKKIKKKVFDFCTQNFHRIVKIPALKESMKECFDEFFSTNT